MKPTLPLNRDDVKAYLPHRDPMLFIDRVTRFDDKQIIAESFVKADAPYFKGHFPDMPIQPGVLIVETVAQAGALLVMLTRSVADGQFLGFSAIEKAKFRRPVYPDETMIVEVEIAQERLPFYKFSGKVSVKGLLVASVNFTATIMSFEPK